MMDDAKYKESSKERLQKIAQTKLRTIMIGSLAILEENLDLSDIQVRNLYENVIRPRILDLGNKQIRNLRTEIDMYDIWWNRYTYKFDVKPREE